MKTQRSTVIERGEVLARAYAKATVAKYVAIWNLVGLESDVRLLESQLYESYLAGYLGAKMEAK